MENRDYKYVMQDTTNLYIGSKYSYGELLHEEEAPFKIRAIVERYILKDISPETTLESHLYYMEPVGFEYEVYKQLKVRLKVSILKKKKNIFGKETTEYTDKIYPLEKFCQLSEEWKKENGIFIQEMALSKLALMAFSV